MPSFADLQKRFVDSGVVSVRIGPDEVLVTDVRSQMSPGNVVEMKLRNALQNGASRKKKKGLARLTGLLSS
jgi:hypothetical protein